MDWGDVATWVASVAATVTLISGFIVPAVNRRRDGQQASKAQAKQVSIWRESRHAADGGRRNAVHIANRSEALISNPAVYAEGHSLPGVYFHRLQMHGEDERVDAHPITFDVLQPGERAMAMWEGAPSVILLVSFTDNAGKLWEFDVRERHLSAIQYPRLPGEPGKRLRKSLKVSRKKERLVSKNRVR